jgi:hypothetical protein
VFDNGVMKRLFGPKKEDVRGDWKKLHKGGKYHSNQVKED